jgi:hypothetical protein
MDRLRNNLSIRIDRFAMNYLHSSIMFSQFCNDRSFSRFKNFFSGYVTYTTAPSEFVIADIAISEYEVFRRLTNEYLSDLTPTKVIIRVSSAAQFNLSAKKYEIDNDVIIYDYNDVNFAIVMIPKKQTMMCFLDATSEIAFVELIRDIVIKHEEKCGSVIIHSAAVERNGFANIICGDKGSGKTTILYDLIFNGDFSYFSGDKSFLISDGNQLYVKGWPDYPHVGFGTLSNHPTIANVFNLDINNDLSQQQKVLLDFEVFYQMLESRIVFDLMPLGSVILPNYNSSDVNGLSIAKNKGKDISRYFEYSYKADFNKYPDFIHGLQGCPPRYITTFIKLLNGYQTITINGNLINISNLLIERLPT